MSTFEEYLSEGGIKREEEPLRKWFTGTHAVAERIIPYLKYWFDEDRYMFICPETKSNPWNLNSDGERVIENIFEFSFNDDRFKRLGFGGFGGFGGSRHTDFGNDGYEDFLKSLRTEITEIGHDEYNSARLRTLKKKKMDTSLPQLYSMPTKEQFKHIDTTVQGVLTRNEYEK